MNILIAEDDLTSRKLLSAQLEAEGHRPFPVADGIEAIAMLRSNKVDAIVSDIRMPRMDGFTFCREVRKDPRFRQLPFVFYSYTFTSFAHQCFALGLGADYFFKKPTSATTILEALGRQQVSRSTSFLSPMPAPEDPSPSRRLLLHDDNRSHSETHPDFEFRTGPGGSFGRTGFP
jgi:CheY-like chemotaxis protein